MIIFYSMKGCGFCTKAKDMLKDEIAQGLVIVKPSSEAPEGINGFPHFTSSNGGSHTGAPSSKEELFKKLKVGKEGFNNESSRSTGRDRSSPWPQRDCATHPRWPGHCTPNTFGWWESGVL